MRQLLWLLTAGVTPLALAAQTSCGVLQLEWETTRASLPFVKQ